MEIYAQIEFLGEIDEEDRVQLRTILRNKSFLKGLAAVLTQRKAKDTLDGIDFAKPGSAYIAAERKGQAWGMIRAVEILVEFAEEQKTDG